MYNKKYLFCALIFFIIINNNSSFCFAANTIISGTVNHQRVPIVRIGLYTNLITMVPVNYLVKVQRTNTFKAVFNLNTSAYGFLDLNGTIYYIFAVPGKHSVIELRKNKPIFKNDLAAENTFLFSLQQLGGWNYNDHSLKISPDSSFLQMRKKQANYLEILREANKYHKLSADLMRFFRAQDDCLFNDFLIKFPIEYASVNHLNIDDNVFSDHFKNNFRYYVNEDYLIAPAYMGVMQNYLYYSLEIAISARSKHISKTQAIIEFMTDTLLGATRDYVLANQIYMDVLFKNKPDTAIIGAFKQKATNAFAILRLMAY